LRKDHREAAERVASLSKKALEVIVVDIVNYFIKDLLEILAYASASRWDEVQMRLIQKGVNPDPESIISVLEEMHDKINFDEALAHADPNTKTIIGNLIGTVMALTKRFVPREYIEKFTYENVINQAEKRNLEEIKHYLTKYPNLTRKLIDWLRAKMLNEK
jgi:hypothetical protein